MSFERRDTVADFISGYATDQTAAALEQRAREQKERQLSELRFNLQKTVNEREEYLELDGSREKGLIDKDGNLTEAFRQELREYAKEAGKIEEEYMLRQKGGSDDVFGVHRVSCKVCEEECAGYMASLTVFKPVSDEAEIQFPTFCRNCKCPAFFHEPIPKELTFPENLVHSVQNFNVRARDINFNCVLMAFVALDKHSAVENIRQLMKVLKDEGIETLGVDCRSLDIDEAVFVRSKILNQEENQRLGVGGRVGSTTIRADAGEGTAAIDKDGKRSTILMQKTIHTREAMNEAEAIQQKINKAEEERQRAYRYYGGTVEAKKIVDKQMSATFQKLDEQKRRVTQKYFAGTSIVGTGRMDTNKSQSHVSNDQTFQRDPSNPFQMRNSMQSDGRSSITSQGSVLMPRKMRSTIKLKSTLKSRHTKKAPILPEIAEETEEQLEEQIKQNKFIQELTTKEVFMVACSSNTFHNLTKKLDSLKTKIYSLISSEKLKMIYVSENKIQAMEDNLTFFPSLFRLTKSVMGAEPIKDLSHLIQADIQNQEEYAKAKQKKGLFDQLDPDDNPAKEFEDDYENKMSEQNNQHYWPRRTHAFSNSRADLVHSIRDQLLQEGLMPDTNKREKLQKGFRKNILEYNFGVLQDFFNYSGVSIQAAQIGLNTSYMDAKGSREALYHQSVGQSQGMQQNLFAISRMGLPNLVLPNSLSIRLSNYSTFQSYMALCERSFPELATSQHTVIVLRPMIVKNGLSEIFIKILKANDFVVLKRKQRVLTKTEIGYLAEKDGVGNQSLQAYTNLMQSGRSEILALSKIGAIQDAKSIVNGTAPFGRRRVPQMDEDSVSIRSNVDSINAMFEISPFSSFSEFFDLEDFIVKNCGMERLKNQKRTYSKEINRIDDRFLFQEVDRMRREISGFCRDFNVSAHCSKTETEAQQEMCLFLPQIAQLQDCIFVMNPLYKDQIDHVRLLLLRMRFNILTEQVVQADKSELYSIFGARYEDERIFDLFMRDTSTVDEGAQQERRKREFHRGTMHGTQLFDKDRNKSKTYIPLTIFHVTKIAADKEIRSTILESGITVQDCTLRSAGRPPYKPKSLPFLFFFMDTEETYQKTYGLLYPRYEKITGQLVNTQMTGSERAQLFDILLQTTVGDRLKRLRFDAEGNLVRKPEEDKEVALAFRAGEDDYFKTWLEKLQNKDGLAFIKDKTEKEIYSQLRSEPVFSLVYSHPKFSEDVHYAAESESHGVYEIRIKRLASQGDSFLGLTVDDINHAQMREEIMSRCTILSHYYNEVSKRKFNVCPGFYRYVMSPVGTDKLNPFEPLHKVIEVEEFMGKIFLEDIALHHCNFVKRLADRKREDMIMYDLNAERQVPVTTSVWGSKLSKMVKFLETVDSQAISGYGKVNVVVDTSKGAQADEGELQGDCPTYPEFYEHEINRYRRILQDFTKGWHYYLSVLETQIIEQKLEEILNSFTFKYTRRMPEMIALIPDRLDEVNVRINEKVKVIRKKGLEKNFESRFFTHLHDEIIDPHREEKASTYVESMLHQVQVNDKLKIQKAMEKEQKENDLLKKRLGERAANRIRAGEAARNKLDFAGGQVEDTEPEVNDKEGDENFSVHEDCSVVGVKVARRCKFQLIASLYYLLNFKLRRLDRKSELFQGHRNMEDQKEVEADYEATLDTMIAAIQKNYEKWNEIVDLQKLKQDNESEFEKAQRVQRDREHEREKYFHKVLHEQQAHYRANATMEQLVESECNIPDHIYEQKQIEALKRFVNEKARHDRDGQEMKRQLEELQRNLGPHSVMLARFMVERMARRREERIMKQGQVGRARQENISIVKMEYFLYCLVQAHEVIGELRTLENSIQTAIAKYEEAAEDLDRYARSQQTYNNISETVQGAEKEQEVFECEKKIEKIRFIISSKETDLILIFREAMSTEYHVDTKQIEMARINRKTEDEQYEVPLQVFWRPINIEGHIEENLWSKKYESAIRQWEPAEKPLLLPKSLQTAYVEGFKKQWKEREPLMTNRLKPLDWVEPPEQKSFPKFASQGLYKQFQEMTDTARVIDWKTSKEPMEGKLFKDEFFYENMEDPTDYLLATGKGAGQLGRMEHRFVKPSETKNLRDSEFSRMSQSYLQKRT